MTEWVRSVVRKTLAEPGRVRPAALTATGMERRAYLLVVSADSGEFPICLFDHPYEAYQRGLLV